MNVDNINNNEDLDEINDLDEHENDIIYMDEELPEIEYYEILTFDEIVLENPTFVAFTKKEIYNELYEIFDNSNKTNNFVDLFYNVVDNEEINTYNYVLITDSVKKKFNENDDKKIADDGLWQFIDSFKRINKFKDLDLAKKEKEKLFFTIIYDENSNLVRFKPYNRTKIRIDDDKNDYILLKNDNTNIPISELYYSVPKSTKKDYLSDKVLSYLNKKIDLEKKVTEKFSDNNINKELNKVKPTIENILKELDIEEFKILEELDYSSLNILLDKFDYNLDKININDIEILNKFINQIFSNIKEEKINLKSFRVKLLNIVNNKTLFYEKNINIFKLLKFTDNIKEENDIIISKLEDEKNYIDNPDLLYNNIHDIAHAIHNNDVDANTIIQNIRNITNYQKIDNIIKNIKDFNTNDVEKIEELFYIEKKKYESMRNFSYNLYQTPLKFLNFSNELYEIKVGNDNSKYFINNNNNNDEFIDYDNKDNLEDFNEIDNLDFNYLNYNTNIFDKYIELPVFKEAHGFKEYLKIILPIIDKIQIKSKLEIDYYILCNNLYKNFSNLPTKFFILKNKIHEYDNTVSEKIISDICNINSKIFINDSNSIKNLKLQIKLQLNQYIHTNIDKILDSLMEFNDIYINNIKNIINHALSIWILEIQSSIINGTHIHNYNLNYIQLWSDIGYPIIKNKKVGVTIYLCEISTSIFEDEDENLNLYNIDKNIIDIITKIIDTEYKDKLTELENNSTELKTNLINRNKGKKYQIDLVNNLNEFKKTKTVSIKDKMLINYVNALIYMPGINYNRIHKYLLGCCLQQINQDFIPDSDMIGKRNDLIAAKTYFSKNRETNKSREYSYTPFNEKETDENIDDDADDAIVDYYKYTKLNHDIFYSSENYNYDLWLNLFNDDKQNTLFTETNYVNIFKNGSNEYIKIIKKYLEYFTKTINNKKSNITSLFINNINNINFKQLIYNSISILSKMHKSLDETDTNYVNDSEILQHSIIYIKYLLSEYNNLNKITNTNDLTDIQRAKAYICVKAICCPFNPDHIIGDKMKLYMDLDDNYKYIETLKNIHKTTIHLLNISKMPTPKENQDFINRMREEFKNRKLDVFDKQTEEQRKVFNELTKIGIRVENLDQNIFNDNEDINQEQPVYNGEDEFQMNGDNDENDPDDLDEENHGFIYS